MVGYLFLVMLGAFRPGEILTVTLVVTGLAVLWLIHALRSAERVARRR